MPRHTSQLRPVGRPAQIALTRRDEKIRRRNRRAVKITHKPTTEA